MKNVSQISVRWCVAILSVLMLQTFIITIAQAEETLTSIRVVTIEYPPIMDAQDGILTDIATEAFHAKGITTTFDIYPVTRIPWALIEEKVPAVLGSIGWFHQTQTADAVSLFS